MLPSISCRSAGKSKFKQPLNQDEARTRAVPDRVGQAAAPHRFHNLSLRGRILSSLSERAFAKVRRTCKQFSQNP